MSGPLRIVFAGTPEFALPALEVLLSGPDRVVAVYTQPDRPAGRGRRLTASPVKQRAEAARIEVRQPDTLKSIAVQTALQALRPDLLVVIAYGLILPRAVLAIPRFGAWNIHASLLPRWRGAAPIQRAIEAGDEESGVCLMQMEAGLDTGPVLLRQQTAIGERETAGSLHDRLAQMGAQVLQDGLRLLRAGLRPVPQPQSSEGVTYAAKIGKEEALLDWMQPARVLERKARAFNPWPIAYAPINGELLRIHAAHALPGASHAAPGTVVAAHRSGMDIACGEGMLRLLQVQRPGGRVMPVTDYLNARQALPHSA